MIPDGDYTAVVDRIEDTLATIELSGTEGRYNLVVGEEELPEEARHADAICHVTVVDEEVTQIEYDQEETQSRKQAAQDRFDRLSQRPPDDADPDT